MDELAHRLITALHNAPSQYVAAVSDGAGEEATPDAAFLSALAEVFGVHERWKPALLEGEVVEVENHPADPLLARLYRGELSCLCVSPEGRFVADAEKPALMLPGSFNPLHEGHLKMGEAAARRTGRPLAFEIGIDNVDKASL